MNLHLWRRLFLYQLLVNLAITTIMVVLQVYVFQTLSLASLWELTWFQIPFYLVLVGANFSIALVVSGFLTFFLSGPYEELRAKINWLLLGKYQHPIFKDSGKGLHAWYDYSGVVSSDLNRIRDKLVQLSRDLQDFAASPTFVGEETKEEIIETERHRIARELHDSVSQQLFAATMMLSAIKDQEQAEIAEPIRQQIIRVDKVIATAQIEMRALLLHLRPIGLEDRSLKQGIEQLLLELQTKIPTTIVWDLADVRLESGIEDHLFRIVQEAISNTLRHARANRLEVYLQVDESSAQLKIVDDGLGFDMDKADKVGSYGLRNIRERVTNLGGECKILSMTGKGTVLDITLPIRF